MEALLYDRLADGNVRCRLCRHHCLVADGERGICQVRQNAGGQLETLVYGRLVASQVDPIEKKPLYHVRPGSRSYSIATVGCNFKCRFCQNADIAQMPSLFPGRIIGDTSTPQLVVRNALAKGCASIAYTYTEPTVFFEFALAVAQEAKRQGLLNVFVTNGYMSREALEMIAPCLDAANVDLKAFSDQFYKEMCQARLAPVKDPLVAMHQLGVHIEVTTLLIPGLNDNSDELRALAAFLVESMGPATPWHISRFHPAFRLTDREPTPVATLKRARAIGMEAGLKYVYIGNVPGSGAENTYCPNCGNSVINRFHYNTRQNLIDGNHCAYCHEPIEGLF